MKRAVVGNRCTWGACFQCKTGSWLHDTGVKAVVVGHNMMQDLIVIVDRNDLTGLRVNDVGHENIVLENAARNGAAAASEIGSGEQLRTEDVIPLLSDIHGIGGDGHSAGRRCRAAGALKVTGCAAARA